MGLLDNVKKQANKDNFKKLQEQAKSKIDQAQDKMGTSGKKSDAEGESAPGPQTEDTPKT